MFMDYSEFLPYLNDSIGKLLKNAENAILLKTTPQRYNEIKKELKIYLNYFKNMKLQNPNKTIDDHVGAILYSYMLNPDLDLVDRDAHYNGIWHAMWGNIKMQKKEEVKNLCSTKNPNNKKWTNVCLNAVDEYYTSISKTSSTKQLSLKFNKF